MIQLTLAEAEMVLGASPTHPHSALEPAPLKDGTYVLPEDVMFDPANADVKDFLATKVVPGDPTDEQNWDMGTMEEPNQADIDAYNAAKLNWSDPTDVRMTEERQATVTAKHGEDPDVDAFDDSTDEEDDEYKEPTDGDEEVTEDVDTGTKTTRKTTKAKKKK